MNETNNTTIFSRQPLSTLGKLSVTALLGGALSSGGLALLIGLPDNVPLLITTAALLLAPGRTASQNLRKSQGLLPLTTCRSMARV